MFSAFSDENRVPQAEPYSTYGERVTEIFIKKVQTCNSCLLGLTNVELGVIKTTAQITSESSSYFSKISVLSR